MRRFPQYTRKPAAFLLLTLLAIGLGVAVREGAMLAARQLPAYVAGRLSAASGRRVTVGRVVFWPLGAFSLKELRVLAKAGEDGDPLTADRARAYVSWWDLLVHHRLRVKALHLDGARVQAVVDLRHPGTTPINATEQLLILRRLGLDQVGVHRAAAEVVTVLPSGERQTVSADGVEAYADLQPASFRYDLRAKHWTGAGLTARQVLLAGRGDTRSITLTRSRARFEGGTVTAQGTYVTKAGDVGMKVQVRDLPITRLAPQLGIPPEWAVTGNLTGAVDLSAASGTIQSIEGTVAVAPGSVARSHAVFPWKNATARIDWRPEAIAVRDIDVAGNGIRMTGTADVGGTAAQSLARRPFRATGAVHATRTEAVASLAQLMTFNTPVPGRWDVGDAHLTFQASGTVGDLRAARARGRFAATGLMVRPMEGGAPVVLRTVQADVERSPDRLRVNHLTAFAEGLSAHGNLSLVPTTPAAPGRFSADGRVDLTSLQVFRQQLPQLAAWKWIDPAHPSSRGLLTIRAAGPTTDPRRVEASGGFRLSGFTANVPAGSTGPAWTVPVHEVVGRLRMRDNRVAVSGVRLRSDLFTATAEGAVTDPTTHGYVSGRARIVSSRWMQLPPLQGRLPRSVSGGVLAVEAHLPAHTALSGTANLASRPVEGTAALTGATYEAVIGGKPKRLPIRTATADFRMLPDRVVVPSYRLVTPRFRTAGAGHGTRQAVGRTGQTWLLHGGGLLTCDDAGELARWWSGRSMVRGGKLTARYTVDAPSNDPNRLTATARIRLVDAQPVLPPGALPFTAGEARIRSLTGTFDSRDGQVRFSNAVWQAPAFRITGSGSSDGRQVDGTFRLTTLEWQRLAGGLAASLPVAGGQLSATARVRGPIRSLRTLPLHGTAALHGARLVRTRLTPVPIEGGVVDLAARMDGPLTDLVSSNVDGTFAVRKLLLPAFRPGTPRVPVQLARGRFIRRQRSVLLRDLVARTPGARLTGEGEVREVGTPRATHQFRFATQGDALARVLPALAPLPGTASGGRFTGSLQFRGSAAQPIAYLEGEADVRDGRWTPPGQKAALPVERMSAHFVRRGSTATVDRAELRAGGGTASLTGTFTGLATRGGEQHRLRVNWQLVDASAWASRLLPVPGWFTGGTFNGQATISGRAGLPVAFAAGKFEVSDAGFMPPQRFLDGPVRPIALEHARGVFARSSGRTALRELDLRTSVGTITGSVVADDRGMAEIQAHGDVSRLQSLIDLWPSFESRVKGGRGELDLALHGPLRKPSALAGRIDVTGRDGVLTAENVDPLYREHPFDEFTTRLVLPGTGDVRLEQVKMRGPKLNLDGKGTVTATGQVYGEGKGWFTRAFTKKLVKPRFLYPLAKLVGFGKAKSSFKLSGTLQQARADFKITHGLLWKLAIKNKVPQPLRDMATGKVPIWSSVSPPSTRVASR